MGSIARATRIGPDGKTVAFTDLAAALHGCDDGLIEVGYAYSPDLLPPPAPSDDGMWRYRRLMPLKDGAIRYPLPVGGTPMPALPALRRHAGMPNLWVKSETRSPTGSNKDRATALVLEHAMRAGATHVTAASTGNVAVSLAVGAAACGIRAVIFVPADVAEGKLRLMLLCGATVFRVEGGYGPAFELSRAAAREFGWYDRNTGCNPLTIEAKKTVAFEIWEQSGRRLPDAVVIPVGDGTSYSAVGKGFRELRACGVEGQLPRLIGVQAEGCAPIHAAWSGRTDPPPITGTIADGINVATPVNAVTALREATDSRGGFVTVSDEAILEAVRVLASRGGTLAEPAAAAGYAGLERAVAEGLIDRDEQVVVLMTGSGMKTPQYLQPEVTAHLVEASLDAVRSVVA